ncbi:MAG: hypothetical protein QG608_3062, partial [Actinomycetota bacterium]|nr:hypothetical protein [Actinomycetota bacterium]
VRAVRCCARARRPPDCGTPPSAPWKGSGWPWPEPPDHDPDHGPALGPRHGTRPRGPARSRAAVALPAGRNDPPLPIRGSLRPAVLSSCGFPLTPPMDYGSSRPDRGFSSRCCISRLITRRNSFRGEDVILLMSGGLFGLRATARPPRPARCAPGHDGGRARARRGGAEGVPGLVGPCRTAPGDTGDFLPSDLGGRVRGVVLARESGVARHVGDHDTSTALLRRSPSG